MELNELLIICKMNKKTLKHNLFNHIMVNGNKSVSERILLKSLKLIQKTQLKKNFEKIIHLSLINNAPTIYIKNIRRKRKRTITFPFLLKPQLRIFYGLKFLVHYSRKNNENSFYPNLKTELINSSKKTSLSFKHKLDLRKDAFLKKKFATYRWF